MGGEGRDNHFERWQEEGCLQRMFRKGQLSVQGFIWKCGMSPSHSRTVEVFVFFNEDKDIMGIAEACWHGGNQWDMVVPRHKLYQKDREEETGGGVGCSLHVKEVRVYTEDGTTSWVKTKDRSYPIFVDLLIYIY